MRPSDAWLESIAARAATLPERIRDGWQPDPSARDDARSRGLLDKWRETVAGGDRDRFARRLAALGTNEEGAAALLSGIRRPPSWQLPDWTVILADLLEWNTPQKATARARRRSIDPSLPLNVQKPWAPFVAHARERLNRARGHRPRLLNARAETKLERQLLLSLVTAARGVDRIEVADAALFDRYPMLGRFVATLVGSWVDTTAVFLDRLETDRETIAGALGTADPPGLVVDIDAGISDRHRGGRTVSSVRFASGLRTVYKPRDPGTEEVFHAFLEWLRRRGLSPSITPLAVLNRGTHGWFQFARPGPSRSREGIRGFYRRSGALLAVLELLAARDCHAENIAVCGDLPVLLDAETLLHRPPVTGEEVAHAEGPIAVLATGLTPYWKSGEDGYRPFGGIGGGASAQARGNLPTLRGATFAPLPHIEEIVAGFRAAYEFLGGCREELLRRDGPLEPLARCHVRVLRRDTVDYARLIQDGLLTERLRDGVSWSLGVESLAAEVLAANRPGEAELLRIVEDELAALARLDVPLMTARADGTGLELDSGTILEGYFQVSAVDGLAKRIDELGDPAGLEERVGLIRAAYTLEAVAESTDLRARHSRTT